MDKYFTLLFLKNRLHLIEDISKYLKDSHNIHPMATKIEQTESLSDGTDKAPSYLLLASAVSNNISSQIASISNHLDDTYNTSSDSTKIYEHKDSNFSLHPNPLLLQLSKAAKLHAEHPKVINGKAPILYLSIDAVRCM